MCVIYCRGTLSDRSNMIVKNLGQSMMTILPELIGRKIDEWFDLVRPLVEFRFSGVRISPSFSE